MQKPLFRGVIHLFSFLFYVAFYIRTTRNYYTLLLQCYNIVIFCTFFMSSVYHLYSKKGTVLYGRLQRLDHSMIYILILTTYLVYKKLCMHEIEGIVENVVFVCTISGVLLKIWDINVSKFVCYSLYALSSFAFLFYLRVFQSLFDNHPFVFLMVCIGGCFYSFGATCFLKQCPNLIPGVLEYHEVFHFFVFLGTSCFFFPLLTI